MARSYPLASGPDDSCSNPVLRSRGQPLRFSEWTRRRQPGAGSRCTRSGRCASPTAMSVTRWPTACSPDPTERSPHVSGTGVASATSGSTHDPRSTCTSTPPPGSPSAASWPCWTCPRPGTGSSRTRTCTPTRSPSSPTGWPRCRSTRRRSCSCTAAPESVRETLRATAATAPDLVYTDKAEQLQRIWRITDPHVQESLISRARRHPRASSPTGTTGTPRRSACQSPASGHRLGPDPRACSSTRPTPRCSCARSTGRFRG